MLTRHGHSNWEGATPQLLRLCSEFHLKRDQHIFSREVSLLPWISGCSGLCMYTHIFGWRTSCSSYGYIMILVMITVNSSSTTSLSSVHQQLLTQPITLVKWLTYGQRSVEVSAPGIIAIDKHTNGCSRTWKPIHTTSWEDT